MAVFSYECPSSAMTGAYKSSEVMGHSNPESRANVLDSPNNKTMSSHSSALRSLASAFFSKGRVAIVVVVWDCCSVPFSLESSKHSSSDCNISDTEGLFLTLGSMHLLQIWAYSMAFEIGHWPRPFLGSSGSMTCCTVETSNKASSTCDTKSQGVWSGSIAGRPVSISNMHTPKLKTSAFGLNWPVRAYWGQM